MPGALEPFIFLTKESNLDYSKGPFYVFSREKFSSASQDFICNYCHKLTDQPTDGQTNQVNFKWYQAYHLLRKHAYINCHKAFLSNYWTLVMWSANNTNYYNDY